MILYEKFEPDFCSFLLTLIKGMFRNGNVTYILTEFGHKNSGGNGIVILEGPKTKTVNIIVKDIRELL